MAARRLFAARRRRDEPVRGFSGADCVARVLIFLVPIVAAKVGPVADGTHRLCKGGGVFLLVFLTQTLRGGFAPAGVTQGPLSHAEKGAGLSRHPQGARAEGSSQGLTYAVRADSKKRSRQNFR